MSGHVLGRDGESVRESLTLHELDVVLVLAAVHRHHLEVLLDAVDRLQAVQMDRPVRPLAFCAQVAPGADLLVAELACLRIDRVKLRQAQAVDRVVLVHQDHARCGLAQRADAAGRNLDRERLVTVRVGEGFLFRRKHLAADGRQVALAGHEPRSACTRRTQVLRDAQPRVLLPVDLHPAEHDLVHDVGTDDVELLLGFALHLPRLPARKGRIGLQIMFGLRVLERERGR